MCDRQREIFYHCLDLQQGQNSMIEQALPQQPDHIRSKHSSRLDLPVAALEKR